MRRRRRFRARYRAYRTRAVRFYRRKKSNYTIIWIALLAGAGFLFKDKIIGLFKK